MKREYKQQIIAEAIVQNAMHKTMAKAEVTKQKIMDKVTKPKSPEEIQARRMRVRNRHSGEVTHVDPTEKSGGVRKKAALKALAAGGKQAGTAMSTIMGLGTGGIDMTTKAAAAGISGLVKGATEYKKHKAAAEKQDRILKGIEKSRERRRNPAWQNKQSGMPNYQSTIGPAPEQALPASRRRHIRSSLTRKPPVPSKVD